MKQLLNVLQDSIQLIKAVVMNHQLAITLGGVLKNHLGGKLFTQLILQAFDVGVRALSDVDFPVAPALRRRTNCSVSRTE